MAAAPGALDFCLNGSSLGSLGKPSTHSIEGLGDENLIAELSGEVEGKVNDGMGERTVLQELSWRAAYIRRGELIMLLMFVEVPEEEFERLVRLADERLQELD